VAVNVQCSLAESGEETSGEAKFASKKLFLEKQKCSTPKQRFQLGGKKLFDLKQGNSVERCVERHCRGGRNFPAPGVVPSGSGWYHRRRSQPWNDGFRVASGAPTWVGGSEVMSSDGASVTAPLLRYSARCLEP